MIYDYPNIDQPIRQGDIFRNIPRIDYDPDVLDIVNDDESVLRSDWLNIIQDRKEYIASIVGMRPVWAIVISQDCDIVRTDDITLCEINQFKSVAGIPENTKTSGYVSQITKYARINQKWFYLPIDEKIGFGEKMAVDFRIVLHISRNYLEKYLQSLRCCCLNQVAREHFRERLSEYFRRYAYNEWYALNKSEFEVYKTYNPDIEPYPWQK